MRIAGCFFCVIVIFSCGCAYRAMARLNVPFTEIYIAPAQDKTPETFAGYTFTQMLRSELVSRTSARLAGSPEDGDVLVAVIQNIGRDIISEDSIGNVISERISVSINIKLTINNESTAFSVIGTAVYEKTAALDRESLIKNALRDAARSVVNRLISQGNAINE